MKKKMWFRKNRRKKKNRKKNKKSNLCLFLIKQKVKKVPLQKNRKTTHLDKKKKKLKKKNLKKKRKKNHNNLQTSQTTNNKQLMEIRNSSLKNLPNNRKCRILNKNQTNPLNNPKRRVTRIINPPISSKTTLLHNLTIMLVINKISRIVALQTPVKCPMNKIFRKMKKKKVKMLNPK